MHSERGDLHPNFHPVPKPQTVRVVHKSRKLEVSSLEKQNGHSEKNDILIDVWESAMGKDGLTLNQPILKVHWFGENKCTQVYM